MARLFVVIEEAEFQELCYPITPGEVLASLKELYDYLANSSRGEEEQLLKALNASIEVFKKLTT